MNKPQFSVVIPLYNKEQHIIRTLNSIAKQSYAANEIIVVDDGSTDNGPQLVSECNIENVTLVQQKNGGVSSARNTGISLAKHEFIAFIDADDQWLPLYLEEIANLVAKFPQAGVYATHYQIIEPGNQYVNAKVNLKNIDPTGELLADYFDVASKGDLPFTMSSMTVRKSLVNNNGNFPLNEPMGEDQDFFARAALATDIAYSPNIQSLYHRDATNRACHLTIPHQECPFSVRISNQAMNSKQTQASKMSMLRYSAAHLCHIAKLNIMGGQFSRARTLLSDPRCKLKPKHRYGLLIWSWIKQSLTFGQRFKNHIS